MQYARLRAIETRRWVARSANTGISAFVSPVGEILEPQGWDKAAAIKLNVPTVEELGFFVRYGDLLSKFCMVVTAVMLFWALSLWFKLKYYDRPRNAEKTISAGS